MSQPKPPHLVDEDTKPTGDWQLVTGCTVDSGPSLSPRGEKGHAQGHAAAVGSFAFARRPPALRGPLGSTITLRALALPPTDAGWWCVCSLRDGWPLGCHGSTSERKMRELGAEGQWVWKEATFMWLTDN